jgi:hypothetical protein
MRHVRCSALLILMSFCAGSHRAWAVDAIVFEVRELSVAGISVESASARLDILNETRTRLTLAARAATLPDPAGRVNAISLVCEEPVIAEPRFACNQGRLSARGGPTGALDMSVAAAYDTTNGVASFSGAGLRVAGTTAKFSGQLDDKGWRVKGATGATSIAELRKFMKPWFELPADISGDGQATIEGGASDEGKGTLVDATITLADLALTNEASTIVTDQMAATARVRAALHDTSTELTFEVGGSKGLLFVEPMLLDFNVNPLALDGRAVLEGELLTLGNLHLVQKDLIDLSGTGSVNLAGETPVISADLELKKLQFPAAYTSYLKGALATVPLLADADTEGSVHGEITVRDNAPTSLHLVPVGLTFQDRKDRLHLTRVEGDIHWTPAGVEAPYSTLRWAEGGAFGLSGGAASMEFVARGPNFALMKPTKLPILDGALAIDTLAMGNLGASNMDVTFEG